MTRHRKVFWLWPCFVCVCLWARTARAYEEQASLDVSLGGIALVQNDVLEPYGVSLDAGAALGLSDLFVLRAALGYAGFVQRDGIEGAGRLRVEAAYLIDVLRWVPFLGLGASAWLYEYDGIRIRPAGHFLAGLDFLVSRAWTVGADVRAGSLWQHRGGWTATTEVQVRLSRMFDLY